MIATPSFSAARSAGVLAPRFDDQRLCLEILEVELELVLLIGGIERRRGHGGGDGEKRRRHLGSVRQDDCDPIAAADSELIQRTNRAIDERAQARVGQRRPPCAAMATASSWPPATSPLKVRSALMSFSTPNALLARQRQSAAAASDRLAQKLRHRIDRVKMRGRDIDEPTEFDHRAKKRVDLCRAAMLDILQHRGLVRADALGAGDALFDAEPETNAERFANGLRFAHHRRGERAGRRETADILERRMVSALTGLKLRLPQSFVQISARMSLSAGDLKPAFVKSSDSAAMRAVFCRRFRRPESDVLRYAE